MFGRKLDNMHKQMRNFNKEKGAIKKQPNENTRCKKYEIRNEEFLFFVCQ
jgi:hypothetical protein